MSNQFPQQSWVAPSQDPYFANDTVQDVRDILGGPPNTKLWKMNGRTRNMQEIKFPPYQYREYPKTMYRGTDQQGEYPKNMYGIGVEDLTVVTPDEEDAAIKCGYVDHRDKIKTAYKIHQSTSSMTLEDGQEIELDVTAIAGDTTRTGKRRGRPPNPSTSPRAETFHLPPND